MHTLTAILAAGLHYSDVKIRNSTFFDTLTLETGDETELIHQRANEQGINLRMIDASTLGISLDETASIDDVKQLWNLFSDQDIDSAEAEAMHSYL